MIAVPLAFGRAQAPELLPGLRFGLEAAYVPQIDDATATPTFCRPGKGPENVNLTPVMPRPRLSLPLPLGLAFEASWVPPIRVGGVKANLFGVSLGRSFGNIDGVIMALRGHATFGSIRAPITCNDDALEEATSECFQGTRSDDKYSPNIVRCRSLRVGTSGWRPAPAIRRCRLQPVGASLPGQLHEQRR